MILSLTARSIAVLPAMLISAALGCSSANGTGPIEGRQVLFIGNSLTYSNDLPAMVAALADSAGGEKLLVQRVTYPNYSLEDHWNGGNERRAIARGGWDAVILQQGPSALPESRVLLLEYTRRFAAEMRREGSEPALFMVWPSKDRSFDFDASGHSYRLAANQVGGLLIPVGDAWQAAWRQDASISLYSADDFHPSVGGSYLAALVIYGQIYRRSPVGLPARLKLRSGAQIALDDRLASVLQAAAAEVIERAQVPSPM